MKVLLIDDLRMPSWIDKTYDDNGNVSEKFSDDTTVIARTPEIGIHQLTNDGPWDVLLLDHDMGSSKTGYDVLCFLEENTHLLPKNIILVTANTSGGMKMQQCLERLKELGLIDGWDWRR